ncbi:alpha/beta hydrolase [Compostibacter hankyongensis]|uniref:AB hydrolase-1 domain-containing protein n=1 Tax=Compostibacter hankyongensis TaxID=1007089 RepID=A0ABP8FY01_9BACT
MQKLLLFPGGPGFNANPELQLLKEEYAEAGLDLLCWHEPSRQRPQGYPYSGENAFRHYLNSAEQFLTAHYEDVPLVLFGHCFGTHAVRYLMSAHPEKIACSVLVTPDFCLGKTDRNLLRLVMEDYRKHGDERAGALQVILDSYTGTFDTNTEAGFQLVAQNPRLFIYYWPDETQMLRFVQHYSGPEYAVDATGFFDVRRSWFEAASGPSSIPVLTLYGKHDAIISVEDEIKNLPRYFTRLRIEDVPDTGHYPHIESSGSVLSRIKTFMETAMRAAEPV